MSRRTLNVIIATPFGPGGRGGMDRLSDAIIQEVRRVSDDIQVRTLMTYGKGSRVLMPFYFLLAILNLAKSRVQNKADLLHINVAGGGSAYRKAILALWARALGVPYIVHLHGSRIRETWPTSAPLLSSLLNALFARSRRIVVLGKVWADYIVATLPRAADKISVLPNATRARAAKADPIDPTAPVHIVFMGLLGERKGSSVLIEALSLLGPSPAWKATIAGNGDVAAHKRLAERLGVAAQVTLPGWLGPAEVDRLLYDADMLVLPSLAENLPMVIIEAYAQGVPVVATPVGAVGEVVEDGVTGLLVPISDARALAEAMQGLIVSPERRQVMGKAARERHAQRFELTGYIHRLIDIWRQCARDPRQITAPPL